MNAYLIKDIIKDSDPTLLENLFEKVDSEVQWLSDITHQGGQIPRKFALQCTTNENGDQPLYRHPMDQLPPTVEFTPVIDKIRTIIEGRLGISLNHAIIQGYRDGSDHITEHADKTIDIVPGTLIVNYSIGASRILKFRSKEAVGENEYKIVDLELTNDSLCVLDLETNRFYKHSIRQNKAITESRISLTFRTIGTFYDAKEKVVYGQGASKEGIEPLSKQELLHAWSYENKSSDYTYETLYSRGYGKLGLTDE
jgi:alkylated DNA repair dioxygenase AlkB